MHTRFTINYCKIPSGPSNPTDMEKQTGGAEKRVQIFDAGVLCWVEWSLQFGDRPLCTEASERLRSLAASGMEKPLETVPAIRNSLITQPSPLAV